MNFKKGVMNIHTREKPYECKDRRKENNTQERSLMHVKIGGRKITLGRLTGPSVEII